MARRAGLILRNRLGHSVRRRLLDEPQGAMAHPCILNVPLWLSASRLFFIFFFFLNYSFNLFVSRHTGAPLFVSVRRSVREPFSSPVWLASRRTGHSDQSARLAWASPLLCWLRVQIDRTSAGRKHGDINWLRYGR